MRHRPLAALAAIALAVAGLGASPALAAFAEKTVEHSITGGTVKIANLAGTIDLVPAASGPVRIVAQVKAEGDGPGETRELLQAMRWVQESDGTWNLAYPVERYDAFVYPAGPRSFGSSNSTKFRGERVRIYGGPRGGAPVLYADLSIAVPRGAVVSVRNAVGPMNGRTLAANLTLDTGSGNVKLDGVAGTLVVDTGSGDVHLRQIAGDTDVDTGSGDVTITDVTAQKLRVDTGSGDVTIDGGTMRDVVGDTGSGDIALRGVTLESFTGDTGSGDVVVDGDLSRARLVDIDTGSGEVRVYGGPSFDFDLTSNTGSGDVRVGYTDAEIRRKRDEVTGARRGSGRTRIVVDTGSGDVVVAPGSRL